MSYMLSCNLKYYMLKISDTVNTKQMGDMWDCMCTVQQSFPPVPSSPVYSSQCFPTSHAPSTKGVGWWWKTGKNPYSTWSQAQMDNLAASTRSSYFKRSHPAACKAVFYSRGSKALTPFRDIHNYILLLPSTHFLLYILRMILSQKEG